MKWFVPALFSSSSTFFSVDCASQTLALIFQSRFVRSHAVVLTRMPPSPTRTSHLVPSNPAPPRTLARSRLMFLFTDFAPVPKLPSVFSAFSLVFNPLLCPTAPALPPPPFSPPPHHPPPTLHSCTLAFCIAIFLFADCYPASARSRSRCSVLRWQFCFSVSVTTYRALRSQPHQADMSGPFSQPERWFRRHILLLEALQCTSATCRTTGTRRATSASNFDQAQLYAAFRHASCFA